MTKYLHDCSRCVFIRYDDSTDADWYMCHGILGGSIIARTGNEPSEYWSSPAGLILSIKGCEDDIFLEEARNLLYGPSMTLTQITLASRIATQAHSGQFRRDGETPYIKHPEAVALAVAWNGGSDLDVAAAWLHDVVEDTPVTLAALRDHGVDAKVVEAVGLLTKKKEDQTYLDYVLGVKGSSIARMVKVEDIKHNLSDLDPEKDKKRIEKYQLALHILEN